MNPRVQEFIQYLLEVYYTMKETTALAATKASDRKIIAFAGMLYCASLVFSHHVK